MTFIIIGAILLILVIWVIVMYNNLASERLKVENQWSQIDIVLKQRADTIPNLVTTVSAYASHEKDLIDSVTASREKYMSAKGPNETARASSEMSEGLSKLLAVAENYPELKANANFLELQKQVTELEGKIADFRQFYNDTVMRYNRLLITVPTNIVAKMFGFQKEDFFSVSEKDKAAPTISFDKKSE